MEIYSAKRASFYGSPDDTCPILSLQPEDHWCCITHLSAEDMLKSVVTEEKKFLKNEPE